MWQSSRHLRGQEAGETSGRVGGGQMAEGMYSLRACTGIGVSRSERQEVGV